MKVYITKYALKKGIIEQEAELCNPNMIKVTGDWSATFYHAGDWHTTRESAVIRANEMVAKKLKSVTKEYERLMKLTF